MRTSNLFNILIILNIVNFLYERWPFNNFVNISVTIQFLLPRELIKIIIIIIIIYFNFYNNNNNNNV